jgi:hypothetical protein
MHGGPSQFETFDPKMDAPPGVRSTTGEIPTAIPGVTFGSTFKKLAQRADKFNIVRSFVTGDGNHDIKPVMSNDTLQANLGSLYSRVAGPLRTASAMPTNVALFPRAVEAEAGPPITDFGNFESAGEFGSALALVRAGWSHVLERRLPGIHDRAHDGATFGRWDFHDDRSHLLGIEVRREIDHVGVGGEGLVLPIKQSGPIEHLVVFGLGLAEHCLVHEITIDRRHAPDHCLEGAMLQDLSLELSKRCGLGVLRERRGPQRATPGSMTKHRCSA